MDFHKIPHSVVHWLIRSTDALTIPVQFISYKLDQSMTGHTPEQQDAASASPLTGGGPRAVKHDKVHRGRPGQSAACALPADRGIMSVGLLQSWC